MEAVTVSFHGVHQRDAQFWENAEPRQKTHRAHTQGLHRQVSGFNSTSVTSLQLLHEHMHTGIKLLRTSEVPEH